MPRSPATLAALALLAGCADEVLLHRLDEPQANQVIVALAESGVAARAGRDGGEDGAFTVAVAPADAARAREVLAARDLPRVRAPGFTELLSGSGLVPTASEEHVRHLHALAGELSRTLEGLDGVLAARVHLAVPAPDPLRPDSRRAPRASVLLRSRREARERVEAQADGVRRLVAGAAEGMDPESVAVVVAPAAEPPPPAAAPATARRAWFAGSALALAVALGAGALAIGRRRGDDP